MWMVLTVAYYSTWLELRVESLKCIVTNLSYIFICTNISFFSSSSRLTLKYFFETFTLQQKKKLHQINLEEKNARLFDIQNDTNRGINIKDRMVYRRVYQYKNGTRKHDLFVANMFTTFIRCMQTAMCPLFFCEFYGLL